MTTHSKRHYWTEDVPVEQPRFIWVIVACSVVTHAIGGLVAVIHWIS